MKPGDRVRYVGGGQTVLEGGPGEVVEVLHSLVRVRVLTSCRVLGNDIRAGHVALFSKNRLEVVP